MRPRDDDPLAKAIRQVGWVRKVHALLVALGFALLLVAALAQRR